MHTQNLSVYLYTNAIIFNVLQNKEHLGNSAQLNPQSSRDAPAAEEAKRGGREPRLLPRSPAGSAAVAGRRGRTPPSRRGLRQGCDACSPRFTGAYEPPPADGVVCCAALLTSQGAGALLPDPVCRTEAFHKAFSPRPHL